MTTETTPVTRDAIAALPHRKLVDIVHALVETAKEQTDRFDEMLDEGSRDCMLVTPGEILELIEDAISDEPAIDALAVRRAENAAYWSVELPKLLDERFDDGGSVVEYILFANPELAKRLRKALAL